MVKCMQGLARFLAEHRDCITRAVEVMQDRWDPTYGQMDPDSITIEVIDFDALCDAIDEFSKEFDTEVDTEVDTDFDTEVS